VAPVLLDPPRMLGDLAERWARARKAAVERVIGPTASSSPEADRLACATEVDETSLHRNLFENGVALGQGFRRFHRQTIALRQLPDVAEKLGVPCLRGEWEVTDDGRAARLTRPPCRAGCSREECASWREAIDGLFAGLVENSRLTRVASGARGASACVDVFTDDPEHPLRWGGVPDELVEPLESVRRFVRSFKGSDVRFLGVCEGALLYRLEAAGPTELRGSAQELIERTLRQKFPTLEVRELSPRDVLTQEDTP